MDDMLILKNALLIDGISREPIPDSYAIVDGKRIVEVGQNLTDSRGCETIDLQGRTLMPGLTDAHIHFGGPVSFTEPPLLGGEATGWFSNMRGRLLNHGVINVRSGGDFESDMIRFRDMLDTGELEGPRTWICGKALMTP
jgi:imidazolonepropionase-like amidohydrolase